MKINKYIFIFIFFIILCLGGCNKKKDDEHKVINPDQIYVFNDEGKLAIGESRTLEFNVLPENSSQDVIVTSSNENIISVSGNTITALKAGTSKIVITSKDYSSVFYAFDVTAYIPAAESFSFSASSYVIYVDETSTLSCVIEPSTMTQEVEYTWTDNKEVYDVIKIDGNVVTGVAFGKAYVTATTKAYPYLSKTITIEVKHELMEITNSHAECIVGAPGEDASTEFNIHYMVRNTSSYALITTSDDLTFAKATPYYGNGEYYYDMDSALAGKFYARNIWHISVSDLTPNTSYIYKIINGDQTESDIYHFTTAGQDETTFLYLTDNHYHTGSDGTVRTAGVSEETIKQALSQYPDIKFVLGGGDRIDTGGNDEIWKLYFNVAESLKSLPFIDIPGNHEYYINQTGQRDNTYYAVYNAATRNGPGDLNGSSSWFKYNDVLFILVDNNKSTCYQEQLDWIADLLENQEYKYSIVVQHSPTLSGDLEYYEAGLIDLFDKYHVTMSLSGHIHSEEVLENYYNGKASTIEGLGTIYFRGMFSGVKSTTADKAISVASAYIFNIKDDTIEIKRIHGNGTIDTTWTFNLTTSYDVDTVTEDELLNSITMNTDEVNNQVTFNWSKSFYGNVRKVTVQEVNLNKISNYAVICNPAYTSVILSDVINGYAYDFCVTVEFSNGKTVDKYFEYNRGLNIELTFDVYDSIAIITMTPLEDSYKYFIEKFNVLIKPKNSDMYEIIDEWSYLNNYKFNSTYILENLEPNTEYDLMLIAFDYSSNILFPCSYTFKTTE